VIKDTSVISVRVSSIEFTCVSSAGAVMEIRAYSLNSAAAKTCVFAGKPFVVGNNSRLIKLRFPRNIDYGSNAQIEISSTAAAVIAGVARFSMRDPIATS
jgi:hypothetical protein